MSSTKGKQGTRGEKTIITENGETLAFYRNVSLSVVAITIGFHVAFHWNDLTNTFFAMHAVSTLLFFGSYKFMVFMAQVKRSPTGEILNCGNDLNMPNGMAEHCKDIILLTSIVQVLALFSEWFWLFLLLVPGRAFYLFWVHIAAPWIFAPAPEEDPMDDKRQRRMERRQMKFKRA